MEYTPPPFFKTGPSPLSRLLFFAVLSLAILIIDVRFKQLEVVRQMVSVVIYPLQRIAAAPASLARLTRAVAESFIVFETRALEPELLAQADAQMDFLNDFFGRIYDRKRANPQDDLTSALVQATDEDGSALTRAEVANVIVAMFGAGFETTAHMLGNGMLAMQCNIASAGKKKGRAVPGLSFPRGGNGASCLRPPGCCSPACPSGPA